MRLPRIHTGHAEVPWVQVTHHALVRFRARRRVGRGEDAVARLAATLGEATVDRVPPGWAAGQQAEFFAVAGEVCFPLVRSEEAGVWVTTTCLVRGV